MLGLRSLCTLRALATKQRVLISAAAAPTSVSTGKQLARWISSSEKKPATHVGEAPNTVIDNPPRTAEDFMEVVHKPRNWISYGYSEDDIEEDRDLHAFVMFCGFSLCLVFGSFIIAYVPDLREADWAHREAFLELARREKYGRPLIDKELIPVERIHLPSEEELVGVSVYL